MNELTIIKRGDAAYIDSREVAAYVGKQHGHLMRDIHGYCKIMGKITQSNFGLSDFFVESAYSDSTGRTMSCYLISRKGCELIAHKLTGEKGVLFTTAYIQKFHEMEQREREELKAQAATPRLKVFNTAVRNVLTGYSDICASSEEIMSFLKGAYKPFGIEVTPIIRKHRWTVTEIAQYLSVYSENGLYHGHAISAIIEKLNVAPEHITVTPYGAVGMTFYYDESVLFAVENWLAENDFPHDIPHLDFEYHIRYDSGHYEQYSLFTADDLKAKPNDSLFDCDYGDYDLDDDYTEAELDEMCGKYGDCDDCPGLSGCSKIDGWFGDEE
jgi:Rha family phage regulatory protein